MKRAIVTVVGISNIKEYGKNLLPEPGISEDRSPPRPEEMTLRREKSWDVGGISKAWKNLLMMR